MRTADFSVVVRRASVLLLFVATFFLASSLVYAQGVGPPINTLSPLSGNVGTQLTFSGSGFGASQGTSQVWVGGVQAVAVSWSDTQVITTIPAGAVSYQATYILVGQSQSTVVWNLVVYQGYLSGRMIMTPWNYPQPDFQPVNLGAAENLDWTYWGLSSAASVDHKSGGGTIGNLVAVGPDAPTQDQNCFDEFTWSNGDVNASVPIACAGLMMFNTGEGFQFTVPADTTPKTLKLYVGIEGATARLEAHLSDNSAASLVDTSLTTDGAAAGTYLIDFQAASAGQTLTVTYTIQDLEWGEVTIEAAVLTPKHPQVAIVAPTTGTSFNAPAVFTANIEASQPAATVSSVSLLQGGNPLLTLNNSPFNFQLSGLAAGNYDYTAQAVDSNGLSQTSDPVTVHVVNSGGELAASVAVSPASIDLTAQGTAGWVLLGRYDSVAVDRKANVWPFVSAISYLDWAYSYYWWNSSFPTFSAEDGPQQFDPIACGVYLPNPGSGFEFTIDAGVTERTAKVYVAALEAQGRFEAHLSDGSAASYSDSSTDSGSQNVSNHIYSLRYHAASEGQKLTIRYTLLNNHNYGNVTLQAVTVDGTAKPSPAIQTISHNTDTPGTVIWIDGQNFGNNGGSVLFNGVTAQVLSWTDGQIEVVVPAGATSGPVAIEVNGVQVATVGFTVLDAGGSGPPASLLPAHVSMLVGESRSFRAVDAYGAIATVASWTSSDPNVADFAPDPDNPNGPPLLTAKTAGQITVNADTVSTDVTVYAGTGFPVGTVRWSVPGGTQQGASSFVVQATPSATGIADLFIVQPSGTVQAMKADGTPVWTGSLGFNAPQLAFPDALGGVIGAQSGGSHASITRLDGLSGKPSWSYRPRDFTYFADDMAIHPDGTIFLKGDVRSLQGGDSGTYIIGIDGASGMERFRVPLRDPQSSAPQLGNCDPSRLFPIDPQYGEITIAPDGRAYVEYSTGALTSCTEQISQEEDVLDAQYTASLRLASIATDGSSTDTEIRGWSSAQHSDRSGSDSTLTEQDTFSPARLPDIDLTYSEVIPDNHGNLLASWSYFISPYNPTCTTIYSNVPTWHVASGSCAPAVGGQDEQAHISVLAGTNLMADLTLDGVSYFDGPMVMGEADTAFVVAGDSNGADRFVAANMTTGANLWSSAGTQNYIVPVAATADGGLVTLLSSANSDSAPATVVRYDSVGNATTDALPPLSNVQYFASDAWMGNSADGLVKAMTDSELDWAASLWDSPKGAQRPDAAPDPKIDVQLRVFNIYRTAAEDLESNATVTTRVTDASDFWWKVAKIKLTWDGQIAAAPSCDRSVWRFGCTGAQTLDEVAPVSQSELKRRFGAPAGSTLVFTATIDGFGLPLGVTLLDGTNSNHFLNLSVVSSSGGGLTTAHELAHQFQLPNIFFARPSNMMCGLLNPSCPPLPGSHLGADQIATARTAAKQLQ